METQSK